VLRHALSAGIAGFVLKTTPAARLAEILRGIHHGRRYVDPHIAASALTDDDCPLTSRELEVLQATRTGVSVDEIAQQVNLAPGPSKSPVGRPCGRRSKRMLSPTEKYEIWPQLVRQEMTMAEAAAQWQVDRSTIMRIRTVAKEGTLAASRPGVSLASAVTS